MSASILKTFDEFYAQISKLKVRGVFKFVFLCEISKAENQTLSKIEIQDAIGKATGKKIRSDHRVFEALSKTDLLVEAVGLNYVLLVEPLTTPQKQKISDLCHELRKQF